MQEMDELYKDCPTHTNTYEVDGVKHKVVSHFVGDRDINDVMFGYAFNKIQSKLFSQKLLLFPIRRAIIDSYRKELLWKCRKGVYDVTKAD